MSIPRMRTAEGVLEIIKEQDPNTDIRLYYIRCLIKSGEVPYTPVGKKKLVDADKVIAYIAEQKRRDRPVDGEIRRIEI